MPQQPSLSPGGLTTPGTPGGPNFSLSRTEWIAIQTYVIDALSLPTTLDQFRNSLGAGAPADLSDFQKLIDAYTAMNTHCTAWQNTIFHSIVKLASDIYDYGTTIVPTYYQAVVDEAQVLITDPTNQQAQQALTAVLNVLQQAATTNQTNAQNAANAVAAFANQTQADNSTLAGTDAVPGLLAYYQGKYGSTSDDVKDLNKKLDAARLALAGDEARYRHDVIVASTTPTYAWMFPLGTIAAAIMAGIYGHDALQALDDISADNDKIKTYSDDLKADANLILALNLAIHGISGITAELQKALPVLQKVEGDWGALAADIGNIVKMINTNIRDVPPIIMNLGMTAVINAWAAVAQNANTFRLNAYVTTGAGAHLSMEAWKVRNLIASPAARRRFARKAA